MDTSYNDENLAFGDFAVQFGGVSQPQLQAAVDRWNGDRGRTLGEVLVEMGALTDDAYRALDSLMKARQAAAHSPASESPVESDRSPVDTVDHHSSVDTAADVRGDRPLALDSGDRFERQDLHAEGGLGQVYEAHDRQLNRTVALKEIKDRYADDGESRERFTKEAEITGRLEHPGIVPVYALGKYKDGRPFYAMRFIKGKSLRQAVNEYHNDEKMSHEERSLAMRSLLGNMLEVCDAIYYAHRRGIVHRDIKPSNIMLGDYGETLVVDWGLAKNLGFREHSTTSIMPGEETLMPTSGSSITQTMVGKAIGSPAFMSPEQARGEHETVEFESDIYGLGATLFMIVTGQAPVEGSSSQEILSMVRKGALVAPRKIKKSVPKALDAICMKAMAFEPIDRYKTVREFKRELERFLAGEPISSYREPLAVRTRRWLRKHPAVTSAMVAALLLGLCSYGVLTYLIRRTNVELEKANARADAVATVLIEAFRSPDPDVDGRNVTIYEKLDEIAHKLNEDKFPVHTLGTSLAGLDETKDVDLDDLTKAELKRTIAETYMNLGLFSEAQPLLRQALEFVTEVDAANKIRNLLATSYTSSNEFDRAIDLYKTVVDSGDSDSRNVMEALNGLGTVGYFMGDLPEAIRWLEQAVDLATTKLGANDRGTQAAIMNLAAVKYRAGQDDPIIKRKLEEVYKSWKSSPDLGPLHSWTTTAGNNLASWYYETGEVNEAAKLFEEIVKTERERSGEEHQDTISGTINLARVLQGGGEVDEALKYAQDALDASRRALGSGHRNTLRGYRAVQALQLNSRDYTGAESTIRDWLAQLESPSKKAAEAQTSLAEALLGLDRVEESLEAARAAESIFEQKLDRPTLLNDKEYQRLRSVRGAALAANQDWNSAERLLIASAEWFEANCEKKLGAHERWYAVRALERTIAAFKAQGLTDQAAEYEKMLERVRQRIDALIK